MIEDNNQNYLHLVRQDCPLPPGTHVVIYCRDSGGEEQDRSISQQVAAAREYCQHFKLIVDECYIDEARLSSNTDKRDALGAMLSELRHRYKSINDRYRREKFARSNPFGVIFWKSNRLGRDSVEATYIKTDLRLRGITLIDLVTSANTGNAAIDALIEAFQQWKDEQDLEELSQNTRRGLAQLVSTRDDDPEFLKYNPDWESTGKYLGLRPGPAPRGFKREQVQIGVYKRKKGRNRGEARIVGRLVPDPELWDRCYLAWKMRHEGASYNEIHRATRLYKNVNGYDTFFQNRLYTGDLDFGGKRYRDFVPALIPREWYEAEQLRKAENRKKQQPEKKMDRMREPRRVGSGYLLSGLVVCGHVDGEEHPMNIESIPAKKGKRGHYSYYICTTKKNSRDDACQAKRISRRSLDQAVIDNLLEHVLTFENLHPLAQELAKSMQERASDAGKRISALEDQLVEVRRSMENIVDALENMGYARRLQERYDDRRREEQELLSKLTTLERLHIAPKEVEILSDDALKQWIDHMREALTGEKNEAARRIVQRFVAKVVIKDGKGTLYYTFPFPADAYMPSFRDLDLRRPHSNKLDAVEMLKSA